MIVTKRFRFMLTAVVGALLVVLLAPSPVSAAASDDPRVTMPTGTTCPAITMYAVRGSNEALGGRDLGAGSQWKPLFDRLKKAYGAENVGLVANGYLAPTFDLKDSAKAPEYGRRVKRGVANAVADLNAYVEKCASTAGYRTLLVVGYSAGADVVRRALADATLKSIPSNVLTGVLLAGDPNFHPGEDYVFSENGRAILHGDFHHRTAGLARKAGWLRKAAGLTDPPNIDPRWLVHSWCHGFDAVCQAGQQSVADHANYATRDGYSMMSRVPTTLPSLVPTAAPFVQPGPDRTLMISPHYAPPRTGPNAGKPATVLYVSILDDRKLVDKTTVPLSKFYSFPMPDKKWHKLTLVAFGEILENKWVHGG